MKKTDTWPIIFELGAIAFWVAAMVKLPDSIPWYVQGFAIFALWMFSGIYTLLYRILDKQ